MQVSTEPGPPPTHVQPVSAPVHKALQPAPGPVKSPGPSSQVSVDPGYQIPSPQFGVQIEGVDVDPAVQVKPTRFPIQFELHPREGPVGSIVPSSQVS